MSLDPIDVQAIADLIKSTLNLPHEEVCVAKSQNKSVTCDILSKDMEREENKDERNQNSS